MACSITNVTGMLAADGTLPVEVLIKSAPAYMAISLAFLTLSKVISSPVSNMTFNLAAPQASLIVAISSKTKLYSPSRNLPLEITISISSAPWSTANLVSLIFTSKVDCPLGNAVATEATFTPDPSTAFFAVFTIEGYTHTAATVGKPG